MIYDGVVRGCVERTWSCRVLGMWSDKDIMIGCQQLDMPLMQGIAATTGMRFSVRFGDSINSLSVQTN